MFWVEYRVLMQVAVVTTISEELAAPIFGIEVNGIATEMTD